MSYLANSGIPLELLKYPEDDLEILNGFREGSNPLRRWVARDRESSSGGSTGGVSSGNQPVIEIQRQLELHERLRQYYGAILLTLRLFGDQEAAESLKIAGDTGINYLSPLDPLSAYKWSKEEKAYVFYTFTKSSRIVNHLSQWLQSSASRAAASRSTAASEEATASGSAAAPDEATASGSGSRKRKNREES